ncbi:MULTISPECIES: YbhB/YbcL family Raf kinase inhibitor-like protein [unclassified Methylobacterium]|jgi:Raf kinase inhibitor-like YbhB/YbcL family protein|uniref:YbhB/YbcL family Raf kinase inhibitor-like protein n=1 Tax=unclassified Methylobacterium TaxID=2615210 RepID=UPI001354162C|nr:YbhB/YbcL family Raf kinase inhibitor-like protein [Methylobacterium sp. 2A]MWV24198.1 YbhB/YbcL family Raf kinase inhibitor-like protein [Methylobacterium sp. 2A]
MLEKIPSVVGEALSGLRAGIEKTAFHEVFPDVPASLTLSSSAFADGAAMPARFTADGAGVSPPLAWSGLPPGTESLVLLVEDAGSPTPHPLVHLIAWNLPAGLAGLGEGDVSKPATDPSLPLGRNSFLQTAWLPPDPPSGHGQHAYLFQIYALRQRLDLAENPGRGTLLKAMEGLVAAKGMLIGTYARA